MQKVLIGVVSWPGHAYCLDEFCKHLKAIEIPSNISVDVLFVINHGHDAYAATVRKKGFQVIVDPVAAKEPKENIINGRNLIRAHALKNKHDFVLFVDSDVLVPPNTLEDLLSAKKDVVSGVYLNAVKINNNIVIAPLLYKDLGNGECQQYTYEGVYQPRLMEIGAAGLGCVLVSRAVLEKVKVRRLSSKTADDIAFYLDARKAGFETWADTGVKCIHRNYPTDDPRARLFEWNRRVEDWTFTLKYGE